MYPPFVSYAPSMSSFISTACWFLLVVFHQVRRLLHDVVKMYWEKKTWCLVVMCAPRKISLLSLLDFFINLLQFRFFFILSHEVKKSCFINRQYFLELEEKKLNVSTYEIWKRLMNNTSLCTQKRCFNQSQC